MFLGIDLGTSAVKVLLLDADDGVVAEASAPLTIQRPRPLWSEQDPDSWWRATEGAIAALRERVPGGIAGVSAIGLSGQMHGATLLADDDRPLRPAILWNDGRSAAECEELEQRVPTSRKLTGNLAMPGFTAPKLYWVARNEPDVFRRIAKVLLPKDFVRLRMTGESATDLSDASGTLWLDVAERRWAPELIEACGLSQQAMPTLFEGPEVTGRLRQEVAAAWGCDRVPVIAGAGDQAAGAIGAGVIARGRALLSLGTSGVYFVADDAFRPNPERAVHAFCHALPGTWHQMAVMLSAASCVSWVARVSGAKSEAALLDEIAASDRPSERLLFLPYLSGERTPHNDPRATGAFIGIDHETDRAALGRAVLEGVAFAFADAEAALRDAGSRIDGVSVIGGGAQSPFWGRILASVLDRPLVYRRGAAVGPALGAARLAQMGVTGEAPDRVCSEPPEDFVAEPELGLVDHYRERLPHFQTLYANLSESFRLASTRPASTSQEN
ncbi:MAG: xylulokinase [Deltaproteobacteria bacterium]|nr:xylulokinase [Deltaproteobacteria bacterium]MBW2396717.1 xylulokinase [Deltaproteobacteria bacterium]